MNKAWMLLTLTLMSIPAWGIVDMRSANFTDTWLDLQLPSSGYNLEVKRTYNSRSLFNGIFGFGWCSDFETRLEITAEGNLKLIECGGGQEINYISKDFDSKQLEKTIKQIMSEVKKRNKDLGASYLKKLKKDLHSDTFLREEFARQLGLKGKIKTGEKYSADGRADETLTLKGNSYIRSLPDGTFQKFDLNGRITKIYDRNGNHLSMNYKKNLLSDVTDNKGRKLTFKYSGNTGKIKEVRGPNGLIANYKMNGEELSEVTNAWKLTYSYTYDDLHNLTQITFPDKTFKKLTYNKDKDWVTSFKDRKGCLETYNYVGADKKILDHYKSTVTKKCNNKVTNNSTFEFFSKKRPDGTGRYLHKAVSTINGKKNEITYHSVFGKPTTIFQNDLRVNFDYYPDGMLKRKAQRDREMKYQYKNSCNKVSKVVTKYFQIIKDKKSKAPNRKLFKTVSTSFKYNGKKCNLIFAENSIGQSVKIGYDANGRIATIKDQAKKLVKIKYDVKFGKPSVVTRPGLGTITVKYKNDGQIQKIDSKQGPTVAVQVASIFNNLLDIIAPATSELSL